MKIAVPENICFCFQHFRNTNFKEHFLVATYKYIINFKFYDVTARLTNNCNRSVKETWETFFLKNHTQNVVEKLVPDPFLKNENWEYLWIHSLKFYAVCFYCMPSWRLSKYIETKLHTNCFHLTLSFFFLKKKKKRSGTSLPGSFSA